MTTADAGTNLLPLGALLRREFLTSLRKTRTFLLIAVASGGVTAAFAWFISALPGASMPAQEIFLLLSSILGVITMLIVPGLAVAVLQEERDQGSFDLLFTTLLRPRQVLYGKLASVLGLHALLILALLPLLGVTYFFVGIDQGALLGMAAAIAVAALTYASIGISVALHTPNLLRALIISYGIILLLPIFSCVSPLTVVGMAAYRTNLPVLALFFLMNLLICLVSLRLAVIKLNHPPAPRHTAGERPIDDPKVLRRRRLGYPFYLVDPRRRKPPIGDRQDPLYRREVQSSPFSQAAFRIRMGYIYAILLILFFWTMLLDFEFNDLTVAIVWQGQLIAAAAPALMASLIPKEHEQGNLDMLRMTLLTPREVVLGKFKAGLSFLAPFVIAVAALSAPVFLLHIQTPGVLGAMFYAYLGLFNSVAFYVALVLCVTMFCRHTAVALVAGYAAVGAAALAPLTFSMYLKGFDWRQSPSDPATLMALVPSPMALPYMVSQRFSPLEGAWVVNQVIIAAASGLLIWASIRIYERRLLRDR